MAFTSPSSSPSSRLAASGDRKASPASEIESGYGSAPSSPASSCGELPQVVLTKAHVQHLNQQLERLSAIGRLRFVKVLFPNLYQTTAFGLTGLVTLDMLSKIQAEDPESSPVDLIFLDTLFHFEETYELVDRVKSKYNNVHLHVFRPKDADSVAEFESRYGAKLYDTASELYDWVAKVEPQQRAYADLSVAAVLTGRRRSQGGQRDKIGVIEVEQDTGIVKINPLVDWSFGQVKAYITQHDVPYNVLLDRGYKSVGDWHSTSPVGEGEDERAGRWKGQGKTECGIHNKASRYAKFPVEQEQKRREHSATDEKRQLVAALERVERVQQADVTG